MMTVKKKPLTPNIVWDAETNKPLCKFNKGVFQTNDKVIADKLTALGYEVNGEADEADTADEGNTEIPDNKTATEKPRKNGK